MSAAVTPVHTTSQWASLHHVVLQGLPCACRDLFVALDTDSSGGIDAGELAAGLEKRGYRVSRHEVRVTSKLAR